MCHKENARIKGGQKRSTFGIDNKEVRDPKKRGLSLFGTRSRTSANMDRSNRYSLWNMRY